MTRRAPVFRWVNQENGQRTPVQVGELSRHASHWEFLYDRDYLALGAQAWELDPADIRTKQRSVFTKAGVVPPPVFCDVAISGWSQDILRKHARTAAFGTTAGGAGEPWGWWERLVHAPADGFGALFVGRLEDKLPLDEILTDAIGSLTRDSLLRASLESSSGAMGGERPKFAALIRSDQWPAVPVIVKFALPSERADCVVAEATALTLAKELGLQVPGHDVVLVNDLPALRIERFDRGRGTNGLAHHCVSAATALGLVPGTDVDDPRRSCVRLRSKLKRPGDALELYRRIVFNGAVGNTDDHPWNTSLRQLGLSDWALSPLYDVMPFFAREGTPVFRMAITAKGARLGTAENLVQAGHEIAALRADAARAVIDSTAAFVRANWRRVFEQHAEPLPDARPDDWAGVFAPGSS